MMRTDEHGMVLVVTLMAMVLLLALGAALVLATSADLAIAANDGATAEAFYAADGGFERAVAELSIASDFTAVLSGTYRSAFAEGPPSGQRVLADGTTIDLGEVQSLASCQKRAGCAAADLDASIRDRPWGPRNPRWRLFSWGPFNSSAPVLTDAPPLFVVILVADDPADTDADPWQDGVASGPSANPGAGILLVRAEAFGRRSAHRVVEGTIVRRDIAALAAWSAQDPAVRGPMPSGFPLLQVTAWREVR